MNIGKTLFAQKGIRNKRKELQLEVLENAFWNSLDDGHDAPPEPRQIHLVRVATNGTVDAGSDDIRPYPQRTFLEPCGHGCINKARLYGKNLYPS